MERGGIEGMLREAYEARMHGDVERIMGCFAEGACFSVSGNPAASPVPTLATGHAAIRESVGRLVAAFEFKQARIVDMVVEGNRAAVHWHVRIRAVATGEETETDLLDLVQVENGKIREMRQFADTALISQLLGR